ncbi:snoRNA-binding rRNA-processing protein [Irineochytrium annulatum]|nr:snoRNA-binding rRNA-processing protein [Irineochytrium annulatum]
MVVGVIGQQEKREAKFWAKFKSPILVKEFASVTSVHFSATKPHDFAVTSSTRVQVYSSSTHSIKKTISRFKDVAYSGNIRSDGKLLVAGDQTGLVQIFDLNSRAILRSMSGHADAVKVARFSPNHSQIVSASDDRTVRVWDLASQTAVAVFSEHEDHVRTAAVSQDNPHLIISGSYDHTVRLWDLRMKSCPMKIDAGAPVESVLFLPSSSLLASSSSNRLKIWNLLGGGSIFQNLSNHQKTVTSICLDGSQTRLLSGSLDHQVKVYNLKDYRVLHSMKYPASILSLAMSPDDTHLVVGMTSGLLSIRQRVLKTQDIASAQTRKDKLGGDLVYLGGGLPYKRQDDVKVESKRLKKLRPYQKMLKQFQYGKALDQVLETKQTPTIVVGLLEELVYRNALPTALGGRDDIALESITRFLVKHISNPRYSKLLISVTSLILDMYGPVIGQSTIIDELFVKLRRKVQMEMELQEKFSEIMGFLQSVLVCSLPQVGELH